MFCPNCGSPHDEGARFCKVCGSEISSAFMPSADSDVTSVKHTVRGQAQEDAYVRASMGYQTFACPNCGMSTLVPDANGITAHCESCGSVIDIRTREVTVERHEHTHNHITYQNLSSQFELSHDSAVIHSLAAAGRLNAQNVVIPAGNGIKAIGDGFLFDSTVTESVELPDGLERIGASAFCNCSKLKEIRIPASVRMIDSSAFENCTSLSRIVIPDNARLGENVFRGCTGLREVIIGSQVAGGKGAFIACTALSHVVIGPGTNVADSMFANCPALTLVDFEGDISFIDEYGFCDCVSLASIQLPKSLTAIRGAAFRGCTALARVDVPQTLSLVGTNAFEDCKSLLELDCTYVTRLGDGVFKGCASLATVTLSPTLGAIPPSMFEGCARMMRLAIPDACREIGVRSFAGCFSLKECLLPGEMDSISREAFEGCTCLTSVGDQAFNVSTRAFADCANLKSISLKGDVSPQAFYGCRGLESVRFVEGTRRIGDAAFMHASSLQSIVIPNGVEIVDSAAFNGCSRLRRVVFAASVRAIVDDAFRGCVELETVVFAGGDGQMRIQQGAFVDNPALEEIIAPMSAFMNMNLAPLTSRVPTIHKVTLESYNEALVKDLEVGLFGDRVICVNDQILPWGPWIMAHRSMSLEGEPGSFEEALGIEGAADSQGRKGLFGIF